MDINKSKIIYVLFNYDCTVNKLFKVIREESIADKYLKPKYCKRYKLSFYSYLNQIYMKNTIEIKRINLFVYNIFKKNLESKFKVYNTINQNTYGYFQIYTKKSIINVFSQLKKIIYVIKFTNKIKFGNIFTITDTTTNNKIFTYDKDTAQPFDFKINLNIFNDSSAKIVILSAITHVIYRF